MIPEYKTIEVMIEDKVALVTLNRPNKANAIDMTMWDEIGQVFRWIDDEPSIRAAVLMGAGKHFCAGIDLMAFAGAVHDGDEDPGRKREAFRKKVLWMQDQFTDIERCRKPVLAAMHGAVVGGAIDMTTCCDMRYCTKDATFSIKEIDIGMTADVGTLQRLPKLIGDGMARELAYTGRNFSGEEAFEIGLVNRVYDSIEDMKDAVLALAHEISSKSPLSIRGIKEMMVYTRDHSVEDGLKYVATWNSGMLMSNDLQAALMAKQMGKTPEFED